MNVSSFSKNELKVLLSSSEPIYVSIFLSPKTVSKSVSAIRQKVLEITLSIQVQMVQYGYPESLVSELLQHLERLKEPLLSQGSSESLAVFLTPNLFRCYRIPGICTESLTVSKQQFHLKPLLPFLAESGLFYLLTFGQNRIRLLQGSASGLIQILPAELPAALENLLKLSYRMEQFQVENMVLSSVRSAANPIDTLDEQAENLRQSIQHYCKRLDNQLKIFLEPQQAPLILAGTSHILSLYRRISTCQQLLKPEISGNPDAMKLEHLHQQSYAIVQKELQRQIECNLQHYQQAVERNNASNHLGEIVAAANSGKITTLLLSPSLEKWGKFNPYIGEVEVHAVPEPGDVNLVELAAIQTLAYQGLFYIVQPERMSVQASIAAIFRSGATEQQ